MSADVALRAVSGMRADRSYVADLHRRYRAGDSSVETVMDSVFTSTEAEEIRLRLKMQNSLDPVLDYVDNHPEAFAGLYLDNARSGDLVVAFTGEIDRHREDLSRRFAFPSRLQVITAAVPLAELDAVVSDISTNLETIRSQRDIGVAGVGSFAAKNAVQVLVTTDVASAQRYFDQRYPTVPVIVEQGSVTPGAAVPGGTGWTNTTRGTGCTVGFSYRNSSGGRGFLTAGHCAFGGDNMRIDPYPTQNYTIFGWAEGGSTDSAPTNAVPSGDTTNNAGWVTITSTGSVHGDQIGAYMCWYGKTTGTQRCGTIASKTYTSTLVAPNCSMHGCTTVTNTRLIDMGCGNSSQPGDSGGPVYTTGGAAFGLIRGSAGTTACPKQYTNYSHIQYALSHWGIAVPM